MGEKDEKKKNGSRKQNLSVYYPDHFCRAFDLAEYGKIN